MRKFVCILLAMLAVPVIAAPVVELVPVSGSPELVDVMYDANGGPLPSGIGLTVSVDAGTIVAVTDYKNDGVSTAASKGYGVFPGQVTFSGDPLVMTPNSPVNNVDFPGTGIDTDTVVLEFGALYGRTGTTPEPNAPAESGKLCTIEVSESCTVTLAGNDDLCGTGKGIIVEETYDSFPVADSIDVTVGSAVCVGDVDGNGFANASDIVNLINYLNANGGTRRSVASTSGLYNAAADIDGNGFANAADIVNLINYLNANGGTRRSISCN